MTRALPATPNAEHLRKEAKSVLTAHQRGNPVCCEVLRNLHHLSNKTDAQILTAKVSLVAVQFALAMDYGFRTWTELMAEAGARLGIDPDDDPTDTGDRFAKTEVVRSGKSMWLTPIPRYPYTARLLDENGNVVRHERDRALHSKIVGNLYCAMNMRGTSVSWPEVAVASGEAFRFAFESHWAQDAEYLTDTNEFVQACEVLGYSYTQSTGKGLKESLALIDESLAAGQAVLTTGWGDRFWQVVVGIESEAGIYRCVGGVDFEGGIPAPDIHPGEHLSPHMAPENCPACPIPQADWYGAILSPEQVVVNPLFIVGEAQAVPEQERIRRVLRNALPMNRPTRIDRVNLENRTQAIKRGPEGHDGWKFYFSPWDSTFEMGSGGIRAWADLVDAMDAPISNFEMIHGIDTTFGGYMRVRAQDAVAWLRWAELRVPALAKKRLEKARENFSEIARVRIEDLGLVRTVPCFQENPLTDMTKTNLLEMFDTQPALIYLVTDEELEMLGERAAGSWGSPWGWRVLPSKVMFNQGKALVAAKLRHIADLRDAAFNELAVALAIL